MLKPDYIPDDVLTDLLDAKSLPDSEKGYAVIAKMSPSEAFNAWLNYNGFIGWSQKIMLALDGLREAEEEAQEQLNQNPAHPQQPL